jgi:hypothetical protein
LPWFGLSHLFYDHQGSERQGTKLPEVTWLINVPVQYTGHMYVSRHMWTSPNYSLQISEKVFHVFQAQVVSLLDG